MYVVLFYFYQQLFPSFLCDIYPQQAVILQLISALSQTISFPIFVLSLLTLYKNVNISLVYRHTYLFIILQIIRVTYCVPQTLIKVSPV